MNDGTVASGQEVRTTDLLRTYLQGSGLDLEVYEPLAAPGRAPDEMRQIADRLMACLGSALLYWHHFAFNGKRIETLQSQFLAYLKGRITESAIELYAQKMKLDQGMIADSIKEFHPKAAMQTDEMKDIDGIQRDAVKLKFIEAPLTKQQLAELIQIPPRNR